MHPTILDQLARARAADVERVTRHAAVHAQHVAQTAPRVRRTIGNAVVALGERIAAEAAAPQPRGVPPGA